MSESTDVQIQGERNINPENRSKHEGFETATKASMWKNGLFLMREIWQSVQLSTWGNNFSFRSDET